MKIYWKSILWNYTVRYYLVLRFYLTARHKGMFKSFLYPHKRFNTSRYESELHYKFKHIIEATKFKEPRLKKENKDVESKK